MTVTIYQTDINNGRRGNAQECPVALAIGRETGWKYVVSVRREIIRLIERKTCNVVARYPVPEELLLFITSFDAGYPPAVPRSFDLGPILQSTKT